MKWPQIVLACLFSIGSAAAQENLVVELGEGIKMDLVPIKKGTFQQGSAATEPGRNADEAVRQVTLTQDFYLGKFPVTRGQFARFVGATGYRTEAETGPSGGYGFDGTGLVQRKEFTWRKPGFTQTDDHPVTLVTYNDARAFVAWLKKKAGHAFDLPTEAQWEYACRAGTATPFYKGRADEDAHAIAWFKANAGKGTQPVGRKKANAFGLFDMSGNVWEWCRDWYGPYEAGPFTDPERAVPVPNEAARRVLRGGSWLRDIRQCRSAARYRNTPGSRNADNGFRVMAIVLLEKQGCVRLLQTRPALFASLFDLAMACPVVIFLALLALVFFVIIKNTARVGSGMLPDGPPPGPARIRTAPDGFWLESQRYPPDSVIHFRYRTRGTVRTGSITMRRGPQGTFVYTGDTPTDVEVLEVMPAANLPDDDFAPEALPTPARAPAPPPVLPPPIFQPFDSPPPAY